MMQTICNWQGAFIILNAFDMVDLTYNYLIKK